MIIPIQIPSAAASTATEEAFEARDRPQEDLGQVAPWRNMGTSGFSPDFLPHMAMKIQIFRWIPYLNRNCDGSWNLGRFDFQKAITLKHLGHHPLPFTWNGQEQLQKRIAELEKLLREHLVQLSTLPAQEMQVLKSKILNIPSYKWDK